MAFLVPDKTETIHGLTIHEKIIPLTAKMNKATGRHAKGAPFRDQRKLKAKGVTAHNTGAITPAKGTTMSEQYSRATYPNQNMGTVRPNYYVDDVEAWHLVREDEVSWCQGEAGNISDISVEIIGPSAKAEDNGARLIAMIMNRHGFPISQLRTHNYWMGLPNKIVSGAAKNCPYYILPHWSAFVKKVEGYMAEFGGSAPAPDPGKVPYTVRLEKGTPYYTGPSTLVKAGTIEVTTNYTIIDEEGNFGRLKSGAGWVQIKDEPAPPKPTPTPTPPKPDPVPKLVDTWARANTLKQGSKGKHVEVLQALLQAKGYDVQVIDGTFGAVTDKQVRAYQKAQGITVDGIVGYETWPVVLK